jgi:hypothetical protein
MTRTVFKGILTILLLLSMGQLWADDGVENDTIDTDLEQPSNMESWQEGWQNDKKSNEWTWFGMGYESRRAASGSQGGTSSGGPVRGQNGNGPGRGGNGNGR